MSVTPMIRDFLVQLEELIDRTDAPGLDRDRIAITTADTVALVRPRPPGRTGARRRAPGGGPPRDRLLRRRAAAPAGGRAFALQFVEALLTGRVDIDGAPRMVVAHDEQLPRRVAAPVPRDPHARPEPLAPLRTPNRRLRRRLTATLGTFHTRSGHSVSRALHRELRAEVAQAPGHSHEDPCRVWALSDIRVNRPAAQTAPSPRG